MSTSNDTTADDLIGRLKKIELISFQVLGSEMTLSLEKSTVDEAMEDWSTTPMHERNALMKSIRSAIRYGLRVAARKNPAKEDMDNLAQDGCLWIAHELVYNHGEKWLVKNPTFPKHLGN